MIEALATSNRDLVQFLTEAAPAASSAAPASQASRDPAL